jgi:hypothetical protein
MTQEQIYADLLQAKDTLRRGFTPPESALYVRLKTLHAIDYLDKEASAIARQMCEPESVTP